MKNKSKICALTMSVALMASLFVGCSGGAATDEAKKPSEGTNKYVMIYKNTGNPYGEKEMEGYKKAIEEAKAGEVILKAPDQPTAEAQIKMIEECIAQKVAAIAISANDPDALEPVLKKAKNAGIKVLSADSPVNAASRMVNINQADPERIGRILVQATSEMIGGKGQIAILSATSQAANQNIWIEWMQEELKDPKYKDIELVKIAYGDDLRDKSTSETEALLKAYPDLKAIVSPTTVGMAAAGKVLTDKGLAGKVVLTGLGLPSEMAEYITNGVCPWMYLWNPIDVGYLTGYAAIGLVNEDITGAESETFNAGEFGEKTITKSSDGGTEILLGDPYKFDKDNIEEWKNVY